MPEGTDPYWDATWHETFPGKPATSWREAVQHRVMRLKRSSPNGGSEGRSVKYRRRTSQGRSFSLQMGAGGDLGCRKEGRIKSPLGHGVMIYRASHAHVRRTTVPTKEILFFHPRRFSPSKINLNVNNTSP